MEVWMAETRGLTLQYTLNFINKNYGGESFNKVMEYLTPAEREILEGKIKSMKWYPQSIFNHLLETLDKTLGQGNYSLSEKAGAFAAEETFNGVFKVFMAIGNPHFLIRQAPLAWKTLSTSGEFEIVELADKRTVVRILNFEEPNKAHCHNLAGYFKRLMEISGGKKVQVTEKQCHCHKDPFCEYEVTWE